MDIRLIKNESDHKAALREIDSLFESEPDTPEGNRLEVLFTLVEAYEREHHPIPLPDPIEAIIYYLESRGLSRKDLDLELEKRAKL